MIGKVPATLLDEHIFTQTGAADERVIQGPAYGEDTAAIQLDEATLVVNTDPLSLAINRIGTLGVNVACNDIAASGADPAWLTSALFLPEANSEDLDTIASQLHEAALAREVAIVGGHSEYAPERSTPLLVLTCFGLTERYISTAGATAGDRIVMTNAAGIEGTAILASDFANRIGDAVSEAVLERATTFYNDISVVEEARALRSSTTAMHDPTEGGVINGLIELAHASGTRLVVDPGAISVREETDRLCEAIGIDPLRIFASGALLATVPPAALDGATSALQRAETPYSVIGTVEATDTPGLQLGERTLTEPIRDEMYPLWD